MIGVMDLIVVPLIDIYQKCSVKKISYQVAFSVYFLIINGTYVKYFISDNFKSLKHKRPLLQYYNK